MRFLLYGLPLLVAMGLGVGLTFRLAHEDPSHIPSPLVNTQIPHLEVPPLVAGEPTLDTLELRGASVTVLNVFASWCIPCAAEHPFMMRLSKIEGVQVVGLNWKDTRSAAQAWLAKRGNPYTVIGFDPTGRVGLELGVYGVPESYVLNSEGVIVYKHVGPMLDERRWLPRIMELLP